MTEENYYKIIISPYSSERIFEIIESQNKLAFIVNKKANKATIKRAIEKLYNVKVVKVNTMITPAGKKKAIVRLHPTNSAVDLATALGLM
ncbi:MAG: 50S ribosomal protein L23 [Candidatus Heimdallarchaeota archaeon]|nr:50S ribosomal protein L23 [Candidatus Heimdallarchaeota archaeon]MCK5047297.1 50S ribosomal protein L23 [Candidatus Heimdallarchaeota archaeon]MCK5159032.1 50S ribosomal protein L23 [Candidatus Heimdallarchaeota archaeon]MCK5183148.1 50S ribosomal protein L23 [Candidatus Heimdallarchaeota archaeon]MCK5298844.1 50S ribosomal protein L23 [Candidatus Heimdallarchaeota archaeon]